MSKCEKHCLHSIGCSELVLWHNECHQRPEGTRQHRVGHPHQDHGNESNEGLVGEEGKHGVGTKGGHCAKVHCRERERGRKRERTKKSQKLIENGIFFCRECIK